MENRDRSTHKFDLKFSKPKIYATNLYATVIIAGRRSKNGCMFKLAIIQMETKLFFKTVPGITPKKLNLFSTFMVKVESKMSETF